MERSGMKNPENFGCVDATVTVWILRYAQNDTLPLVRM